MAWQLRLGQMIIATDYQGKNLPRKSNGKRYQNPLKISGTNLYGNHESVAKCRDNIISHGYIVVISWQVVKTLLQFDVVFKHSHGFLWQSRGYLAMDSCDNLVTLSIFKSIEFSSFTL